MHFNKSTLIGLFSAAVLFATSCNSNQKTEGEGTDLTPVEGNDPTRYNLNEPDKDLIDLDSSKMDSTIIDSAQ